MVLPRRIPIHAVVRHQLRILLHPPGDDQLLEGRGGHHQRLRTVRQNFMDHD